MINKVALISLVIFDIHNRRCTMGFIISISGASGSGKTTFARELEGLLPSAAVVHMDHFDNYTEADPQTIQRWFLNGANADEMELPHTVRALESLSSGVSVKDPQTHEVIKPAEIIFLESPFGYEQSRLGELIDGLVWLDTPADICLARKCLQLLNNTTVDGGIQMLSWLQTYLDNYLLFVAELAVVQRDRIYPSADVTISITDSPQERLQKVLSIISD